MGTLFRVVSAAVSKLTRVMEEQGKEWYPASHLRDLAAVSELKRDIMMVSVTRQFPCGSICRKQDAATG